MCVCWTFFPDHTGKILIIKTNRILQYYSSGIRRQHSKFPFVEVFALSVKQDFLVLTENYLNRSISNRKFDYPGFYFFTKPDHFYRHSFGLVWFLCLMVCGGWKNVIQGRFNKVKPPAYRYTYLHTRTCHATMTQQKKHKRRSAAVQLVVK